MKATSTLPARMSSIRQKEVPQRYLDSRVPLGEHAQQAGQELARGRPVEADRQALRAGGTSDPNGSLRLGQEPPTLRQQRPTSRRELDPAAGSFQQRHAELLLQPSDLMAQRRLGDMQALRGAPEVKLLGDDDEVLH